VALRFPSWQHFSPTRKKNFFFSKLLLTDENSERLKTDPLKSIFCLCEERSESIARSERRIKKLSAAAAAADDCVFADGKKRGKSANYFHKFYFLFSCGVRLQISQGKFDPKQS
jgi:hypothetical protein